MSRLARKSLKSCKKINRERKEKEKVRERETWRANATAKSMSWKQILFN